MTFKYIQRVGLVSAVLVGIAVDLPMRAQVPVQDRQPAGSALRPAVAGPTGGVSTGHPLTTAAAFAHAAEGRQCVRRGRHRAARRRRRRAGSLQPRRRGAGARLSAEGEEGHLHRRPGLGAEGRQRRLVPVARQDAAGRRPRPGGRPRARCTPRSPCSRSGAR